MYLAIGSSAAQSLISLFHIWAKECLEEKGNIVFISHIWALHVRGVRCLYILCIFMYLNVYSSL